MKITALLAATGCLAGCASTNDVLSSPPTETFQVTKSSDEVAFCLATKNNTSPLPREDGSRVILIKNAVGAVGTAFTVYPAGSGSRVEMRRKIGIMVGGWKQCVGRTD